MPPRSAKKALAKKRSPGANDLTTAVATAASLEAEVEVGPAAAAAANEVLGPEEVVAPLGGEEEAPEEEASPPAAAEVAAPPAAAEVASPPEAQEKVEDSEAAAAAAAEAVEIAEPAERQEFLSEVEIGNYGPSEMDVEEGTKQNTEEGTVAAKVEDTDACGAEGDNEVVGGGGKSGSDDDSDNEEDEEEVDPSAYLHYRMMERRMNKDFEIFIGGLGKEAVEDNLIKVFSEFGEIQSARIIKHPVTQKSKGFAFIRYATIEQAEKVLAEFKDGIEVKGKRVGILPSLDNDTLYLGNICKTWSKDHVLETLKVLTVEQIEGILLPDDLDNEGMNKGFAFLEFTSHSDAMAAFLRLGKPDAIFGCDRSAKVAFAHTMLSNEEAKSQVKTVYLEGLPLSWDEEKLKEVCKQYGEIEKIQVTRKFNKNKRKCLGFVAFISKENAVACMEGINNGQLGEGEGKVKAELAKPSRRGWRAKQGARGGFKVADGEDTKEAGPFKTKGQVKSNITHEKKDSLPQLKGIKEIKSSKSLGKAVVGKAGSKDRQKIAKPFRVGKRSGKGIDTNINARPSKKSRKDRNIVDFGGRRSSGFNTQGKAHFRKAKTNYTMHPTTHASGYAALVTSYHSNAYGGASGSKHRYSDLEPHAGYIPAAKQGKQGEDPYRYAQRRVGGYDNQQYIGAGVYENQQGIHSGGYYNQQGIGATAYDNQQRIGATAYDNQQRIGGGTYDNQQMIGAAAYDNQQRISASGYDNQQRMGAGHAVGIGAGAYDNQQRIGGGAYDNTQMIGAGGYDNQQRIGTTGYDNQQRIGAGYAGAGSVLQPSHPGHSSYAGYEAGYAYPDSGYMPQGPYY